MAINMTPKISVIMSVYNAENYVGQAVDSILNQSFTDFEFLILDDGSTDNSWDIISAYTDNRISIFRQKNQGINASRNFLINKAKGQFIALLDADDIAVPNRLQQQYDHMQHHPNCAVVGMHAEKIGADTGVVYGFNSKYINVFPQDILYNHKMFIVDPSYMIRKSALHQLVGPYKSDVYSLDSNLWRRLSYVGQIDNICKIGIKYRVHKNSYSYDKQAILKQSVFFSVVSVYEQYKNNKSDSQLIEYDKMPNALYFIRKKYNLWHPIWGVYMYYCKQFDTLFNLWQRVCIYISYRIHRYWYLKKRK